MFFFIGSDTILVFAFLFLALLVLGAIWLMDVWNTITIILLVLEAVIALIFTIVMNVKAYREESHKKITISSLLSTAMCMLVSYFFMKKLGSYEISVGGFLDRIFTGIILAIPGYFEIFAWLCIISDDDEIGNDRWKTLALQLIPTAIFFILLII